MASDNQVTIEIVVDAKDAQKAIDQFGASAVKSVKQAETSFKGLGGVFSGATASLIGLVGGLAAVSHALSEAADEEKNIRALGLSLAGTGEYTAKAVEQFKNYADALSEISGIDDGAILSAITLAKSFGITNEQAQNLTTAATNLSAITGQDLTASIKQLGGTFDGTLGKLSNLGPEFRNLTKDQIENGAAIDLINQKYGDAAKSLGDSFDGSLNKLKNSFNDTFKEIGRNLLEDGSIKQSIQNIIVVLKELTPAIVDTTKILLKGVQTISVGFSFLATAAITAIQAIAEATGNEDLSRKLDGLNLSLVNTLETLTKIPEVSASVEKSTASATEQLVKLSAAAAKGSKLSEKVLEDLVKQVGGTSNAIEQEGRKVGETLAAIDRAEKKGEITRKSALDLREKSIIEFNTKIIKYAKDTAEKEAEETKKHLGDLGVIKLNFEIDDKNKVKKNLVNILEGIDLNIFAKNLGSAVNSALKGGDEKARFEGIGSAISGVLTAYLGPLGNVLGDFITQLSLNNKQQTKEFINAFIDSVPDFVLAVADNFPAIFEGLFEVLGRPSFWERAAKSFVNAFISVYFKAYNEVYKGIYNAFAQGAVFLRDNFKSVLLGFAPQIRDALISAFPFIGQAITDAFSRLGAIFDGIIQAFKDLFQPLFDAFHSLEDAVRKLTDAMGKGGGKGLIAEAGSNPILQDAAKTYFSGGLNKLPIFRNKGGMVYAADGFVSRGTDTVPAMLTPGEMVIPVDLVGQLANFLSGQQSQSSSPVKSDAILTAILQAVQQPVTVNSSVKVNQSAFADIILQLNRQNARLVA